jgi:hypothetical protein
MEFSYLSDITGNPIYKEKVEKTREVLALAHRYTLFLSSQYWYRETNNESFAFPADKLPKINSKLCCGAASFCSGSDPAQ